MPQHSVEPTPTPGLGTLSANVVARQIDGRDGRIFLQRLSQGLEAATDQGWHLGLLYRQILITQILRINDIELRRVSISDSKLGTPSRYQRLLTASTCLTTLLEQK